MEPAVDFMLLSFFMNTCLGVVKQGLIPPSPLKDGLEVS